MIRLLALLLLAVGAQAQTFAISGEVRHRSEADGRDLGGADPAAAIHLLRTRLAVEARAPRVRAMVQIQDARLWGGEDPSQALGTLDGDADQLDLHQAFVELDSLGGQAVSLRVGRQEIAVANQRLVGSVRWSNVGRSFDAVRLRAARGPVSADVFAAQLVSAAQGEGAQALVGAVATWTAPVTVEAFAFVDADDGRLDAGPDAGARRRERLTGGARAWGTLGPIRLDAEAVGQTGARATAPDGARADLRAVLVSAESGTEVAGVTVALGATRLSGDADPADGTDRRFDTLFATNHTFYGAMDLFPRLSGTAGLDDRYATLGHALGRGWRATAAAHVFATAVDTGTGRALGTEVDVTVGGPVAAGARLALGASVFRAAERFADETTTAWGFAMLTAGF